MCGKLAEIHEFMETKISPSSGGRAADQRLNPLVGAKIMRALRRQRAIAWSVSTSGPSSVIAIVCSY